MCCYNTNFKENLINNTYIPLCITIAFNITYYKLNVLCLSIIIDITTNVDDVLKKYKEEYHTVFIFTVGI